jgi:hypothetical protein
MESEHLSSKHETLSTNRSTSKKIKVGEAADGALGKVEFRLAFWEHSGHSENTYCMHM